MLLVRGSGPADRDQRINVTVCRDAGHNAYTERAHAAELDASVRDLEKSWIGSGEVYIIAMLGEPQPGTQIPVKGTHVRTNQGKLAETEERTLNRPPTSSAQSGTSLSGGYHIHRS